MKKETKIKIGYMVCEGTAVLSLILFGALLMKKIDNIFLFFFESFLLFFLSAFCLGKMGELINRYNLVPFWWNFYSQKTKDEHERIRREH